jgi:hypothetical protein
VVVDQGRADGREAEGLLEGARRGDHGVILVHLERVEGERVLGLRGWEAGRLHRVVERVMVEVGLCLCVGGHHHGVDGGDLGRSFSSSLGWLIRKSEGEGGQEGGD